MFHSHNLAPKWDAITWIVVCKVEAGYLACQWPMNEITGYSVIQLNILRELSIVESLKNCSL